MKSFCVFSFLFCSLFLYSQTQNKKQPIAYANMSSISITNNTENYFSSYETNDEKKNSTSFGFDLNTIQGVKFFELISISAGIALDWNINKTFISTPCVVDFRFFSSRSNQNGFFAYVQTGKNIKWTNSFDGNGTTSKLGAGVIIKQNEDLCFYVDIFKKSKQIETEEFKEKGYYNVNGYGISVGLTFN